MQCERCYRETSDGEHGLGLCPLEPRRFQQTVWTDDIPGGLLVEHGLCNDDGSPRRYDSKSAIRAEAKARGLYWWPDRYDESETREGRERMEYLKTGEWAKHRREKREARLMKGKER